MTKNPPKTARLLRDARRQAEHIAVIASPLRAIDAATSTYETDLQGKKTRVASPEFRLAYRAAKDGDGLSVKAIARSLGLGRRA